MNLQSRVLILNLCIAVLVLVLIGGVLLASLHEQNLNTLSEDTNNQLKHIDFSLSNFIWSVRYDVLELSLDEDVRTPDDAGFTNFLNAFEDTFRHSISDQEQDIIDIMKNYQMTHPYVSSVSIGRENGAGTVPVEENCPVPWRGYHGRERAAQEERVHVLLPDNVREAGGYMTKVLVI